ncbi:hypothetical protein D3C85_1239350 [compost metagenome]
MAPTHCRHTRVFSFDAARKGGREGIDAFDRADQPVEQVHIVAGLVHERAAVPLPLSAPTGRIVVILRSRPEDVDGDHVDPAEAALVDGLLQQLQGGVAAVLLDDEKADAGFVAGLDHALAVFPARGHGLFADDMAAGLGDLDGLPRMQARGRGQDHGVGGAVGQQLGQR